MRDTPTATYRLQLHRDFTFADAAEQVPYLQELGVSHLYLSPILTAMPGSMHGYDVVNHSAINPELGGREGFEALVQAAHEHDLGIIVDVVPNHMAFAAPENLNHQLWQVLRDGQDAATAEWFDIDWAAGDGKLGIPVLGETLEKVLAAGELTIDSTGDEPVLRYYDHVWPIAPGTVSDDVAATVAQQHYRLACWREKDQVLNYRRFFEVDELIAVRVEIPEVFDATHALLLDLHNEGLIDGFRIDHPDGLADPVGYLERLTDGTERGTPIWVEKILEGTEQLPSNWPCAGTTGYDVLGLIDTALIDEASAEVIENEWVASGGEPDYETAVAAAKRQVVTQSFGPEVERLTRRAAEALPDHDPDRLREAITELVVAGEVYRAYAKPETRLSEHARARLSKAFVTAAETRPDLGSELTALVPLTVFADDDQSATDFGIRLQQTWGPVMAKGIEDTTFYRWNPFVALNEVGGDPTRFATAGPERLVVWSITRPDTWPRTMTTLSTHDTKRSEDVRARLVAVGGDPDAWSRISAAARKESDKADLDADTGHFVWQTVLGVGPIDDDRLTEYLTKALREAKLHSTWTAPDEEYEAKVIALAKKFRDSGATHDAIEDALTTNAEAIRACVLGARTLELTIPGIPDTYQGCEAVNLSLVDPDNRRPVDYAANARALISDTAWGSDLSADKTHLVGRLLDLRKRLAGVFEGGFQPVKTGNDHLIAYTRGNASRLRLPGSGSRDAVLVLVTRAPARLARAGGWADTEVKLPDGPWRDVLTGVEIAGGTTTVGEVLEKLPVAVLEKVS